MSEETQRGPLVPVERRPLTPGEEHLAEMLGRVVQRTQELAVTAAPRLATLPPIDLPSDQEWVPSEPERKVIDEFMEKLEPDVERYAKDLVRQEVRDTIVKRGPRAITVIRDALKKGKKVSLKRKKGCIFVQLGDGTPSEPIEEILVAQT